MKHVRTPPLLIACLLMTACDGFNAVGVNPDPLPPEVAEDCPHASEISTGGDWEIYAGRLGDALNDCRAEKQIAVTAFNQVADALTGPR